ncbi:MAG: DUF86 domain-containing protein [Planctomycetaceae bacterium]|nr:DUF86 domain-containing protein [Planctomycetaceae bacterium]
MSDKFDRGIVIDLFQQIVETLGRIEMSFSTITTPDSLYDSYDGKEKLDAICMKLLAVGEILKKIDNKTSKSLLAKYEGIDWVGFIGLRDIIAHDYYNINPEKIYGICSQELEPLMIAIAKIISDLQTNNV